jgi:hypothetical protein
LQRCARGVKLLVVTGMARTHCNQDLLFQRRALVCLVFITIPKEGSLAMGAQMFDKEIYMKGKTYITLFIIATICQVPK